MASFFFTQISMACSQNSFSYNKYAIKKRNPDPKSSALLVVDVQNYFSSMATPILQNIQTTIDVCRKASIPIIFTRHCHKSTADYGMLAEWSDGEMILDGTHRAELMPELNRWPGDQIVDKSTYSGFQGTRLESLLKERNVEEVIVTGVMTNLCCETTARDAFVKGYRVFFSTDATATLEPELHEATLMNLAFGFAYLVDCKSLHKGLSGN